MFDVLIKGIVMGVAIAAPVGPIGILCIQRTLKNGRASGLAAGLGAASADALYGILVATGLVLTGLLTNHGDLMRLVGSLLLIGLGIMSIRQFIRAKEADAAPIKNASLLGTYSATFALTLANPMTIVAFIGMIGGLGAGAAKGDSAYLLVLGVFTGSAIWWLFLVHLALAVKHKIPANLMRWLDLLSGGVLVLWGGILLAGVL